MGIRKMVVVVVVVIIIIIIIIYYYHHSFINVVWDKGAANWKEPKGTGLTGFETKPRIPLIVG